MPDMVLPAPDTFGPSPTALAAWAASGAMALTGRATGAPLAAPGRPAGLVSEALARTAELTDRRTGTRPALPDVAILGERAAIAGLSRNAPWSCGGSFRALHTRDGWLGLSLPRTEDLSLVPALVEFDPVPDPWAAAEHWAASTTTEAATHRMRLLGIAGGPIPWPTPQEVDRPPAVVTHGPARTHVRERPLVIDLTALWAGPLCAHLLGLGGAEIVKVESRKRPDGARNGPRRFFDLLHAGHRMVALDFHDASHVAALRALVERADLVLEASRPRALRQLGIHAEGAVSAGTSWLSITAAGRDSERVGFGDDVAAGAGLTVLDNGVPVPCGDALADPLAGVVAAREASAALLSDRARMIDVSMHHVAMSSAGPQVPHAVRRVGAQWWVEDEAGDHPVLPPRARSAIGVAGPLGADNAEVLVDLR